jgi:hypothetical protein
VKGTDKAPASLCSALLNSALLCTAPLLCTAELAGWLACLLLLPQRKDGQRTLLVGGTLEERWPVQVGGCGGNARSGESGVGEAAPEFHYGLLDVDTSTRSPRASCFEILTESLGNSDGLADMHLSSCIGSGVSGVVRLPLAPPQHLPRHTT